MKMNSISRLARKKKKEGDGTEIEREPRKGRRKGGSFDLLSPRKKKEKAKEAEEADDDMNTESKAEIAEKIGNSKNIQKFVARFAKAEGIKFLQKKKRKVGTDMYKRAYDHDKTWKVGVLRKQGGKVKTWKSRFFVLRRKLIFYFESLEAFENGLPPKGWIWVRDMIPNKKEFVCTPTYIYTVLFKPFVFTIQTERRTFAISTRTKEERTSWMRAVQEAYNEFWDSNNLPIPKYPGPGVPEAQTLVDLLPLAKKLDSYDELEQAELESKTRLLMLAECFVRWKTFVKLEQLVKNKV